MEAIEGGLIPGTFLVGLPPQPLDIYPFRTKMGDFPPSIRARPHKLVALILIVFK